MMAVIRKTLYFCRRNGLRSTLAAVRERLSGKAQAASYQYVAPGREALKAQRESLGEDCPLFSIVVPLYQTKPLFLEQLIDSLLAQSYPYFELLLGDFSADASLQEQVEKYQDERIRYTYFGENQGISENTNRLLPMTSGSYVGLLDHDDVLTPDALYEMYQGITSEKATGKHALLLFSDEDKWSGEQDDYYDCHEKGEYNRELLFSYNYICHFLMIERDLICKLGFRDAYSGAQDYDLVLRATNAIEALPNKTVVHIPKVLYHWRCHKSSTAENPKSKLYAYEAGRAALETYFQTMGVQATVSHRSFVGMYQLTYEKPYLEARPEIGIAGGRVMQGKTLQSGRLSEEGKVYYEGSKDLFGGYFHRAILPQDGYAVDLRCACVRKELEGLVIQVLQIPFEIEESTGKLRFQEKYSDEEWIEKSIAVCQAIRQAGYGVVWNPDQVPDTKL